MTAGIPASITLERAGGWDAEQLAALRQARIDEQKLVLEFQQQATDQQVEAQIEVADEQTDNQMELAAHNAELQKDVMAEAAKNQPEPTPAPAKGNQS